MITRKDILALTWAVKEAEAWRGSLVGNPDPIPLEMFDKTIKEAKQAVKNVRAAYASLEAIQEALKS